MIDDKTIKSLYDDKPTLLEWLKRVEAQLNEIKSIVKTDAFETGVLNVTGNATINKASIKDVQIMNAEFSGDLINAQSTLYYHFITFFDDSEGNAIYLPILFPKEEAAFTDYNQLYEALVNHYHKLPLLISSGGWGDDDGNVFASLKFGKLHPEGSILKIANSSSGGSGIATLYNVTFSFARDEVHALGDVK